MIWLLRNSALTEWVSIRFLSKAWLLFRERSLSFAWKGFPFWMESSIPLLFFVRIIICSKIIFFCVCLVFSVHLSFHMYPIMAILVMSPETSVTTRITTLYLVCWPTKWWRTFHYSNLFIKCFDYILYKSFQR